MTHRITRFLLRQKLLLGVLWLMLRGSSVSAQNDSTISEQMCYSLAHVPDMYKANDISVFGKVSNDWTQKVTGVGWAANLGLISLGVEAQIGFPDKSAKVGPAIKLYPAMRYPFSLTADINFLKGISNNSSNEANFALGLTISDNTYPVGIEVFGNYCVNFSSTTENGFFIGVRFHYYLKKDKE